MTMHGLSFDIEDWQQLAQLRVYGQASEPSTNVDACIARILDVCEEANVKATFFVLGLLAKSRPHLVKRIAERGHEVASHSTNHRLVHQMSAADFLADTRDSKAMLEDLTGQEVVGFRAPEFSVQRLDHSCFETLRQLGFTYDSSVFPIGTLRYGIPDAPTRPFRIETPSGSLVELPLATFELSSKRLPLAGGSHFRVLPTSLVRWAAKRADRHAQSLIFYFHPYEFSKQWLRLPGGWASNRRIARHVILHNFATWRVRFTLKHLMTHLQFAPLRDIAKTV